MHLNFIVYSYSFEGRMFTETSVAEIWIKLFKKCKKDATEKIDVCGIGHSGKIIVNQILSHQ